MNIGNLRIFGHYAGQKVGNLDQALLVQLASWDPTGVGEAGLATKEDELDALGLEVIKARDEFHTDELEYQKAMTLYNQRLASAELLNKLANDPSLSDSVRAAKATARDQLLAIIEDHKPEMEGHKAEYDSAKNYHDQLEANYTAAAARLTTERNRLNLAARDMKLQQQRQVREEDRARVASMAAGISANTGDRVDAALAALKSNADHARQAADAAVLKQQHLAPTNAERDNPDIAEAMQQAAGSAPPPVSADERIAALRKAAA